MFDFMDMDFTPSTQPDFSGPYLPDAGECMRCGLCVSHCPTFRLFQNDEETPRRRVNSMRKLLIENRPVDSDELQHLNNCLQCRACEPVCPSHMAYAHWFDRAREQLQTVPSRLAKLAFWLIEHKRWRARLMPLLWVYLKSGLQKPLRKTALLNKLGLAEAEALLQLPAVKAMAERYPAQGSKRGSVALFTGCIAEQFDRDALSAAITLLNAIGYEVLVPPQQGCCGAIHQHNGVSAEDLITNNIHVFNRLDVEAVLYTASGCGVMLSEYQADDAESARRFKDRTADIHDFLNRHWPDWLSLKPSSLKVAVHEPCSQRNVLKNQQSVYSLLEKIPGLSAIPLAENATCCGAGGSYMLTHPGIAGQLRQAKLEAIQAACADRIVSSNFGCAVFLGAGMEKIVHPLQLLAWQLPD